VASEYGKNRNMRCDGCGLGYDDFRTGLSFTDIRRMIISIGTDRKTQRTKYGRRHGVLGYHFELKQLMWRQHVDECASAKAESKMRTTKGKR
jgi:hypothetical protein